MQYVVYIAKKKCLHLSTLRPKNRYTYSKPCVERVPRRSENLVDTKQGPNFPSDERRP